MGRTGGNDRDQGDGGLVSRQWKTGGQRGQVSAEMRDRLVRGMGGQVGAQGTGGNDAGQGDRGQVGGTVGDR